MFKIGNVEIENNVCLAPMAGICNSAFRRIIKEEGCSLVFAEMVSDKGLIYNSQKTKDMLYCDECERPIAQQIFGSDKDTFVEAAKMVYEIMKPDIIDINMGCPAPKVVKNGDGSKLLLDLPKAYEIIKEVVKSVSIPVTVKFRKGWDNDNIVAVDMAKIAEDAGASAITIHGRTRSEFYSGTADWNIIKSVKENVNIKSKASEKNNHFKFFKEMKAEVKRITWPSKDDTKKALIAVGVICSNFLSCS